MSEQATTGVKKSVVNIGHGVIRFVEASDYDLQSDYSYWGFTNSNNVNQVNRRSTTSPYTKAIAIGAWSERYSLSYS